MISLVGIVVVTHGTFAKSIVETTKMFISNLKFIQFVELHPSQNMEEFKSKIESSYTSVNNGKGVLLLTDLFGGTPTNKVFELMYEYSDIECVTGVNLGMLLEVLFLRNNEDIDLADLAEKAVMSGQSGIVKIER